MSQVSDSPVTYSIGQLAEEFDITSRALRLYEEEGLLVPERVGTRRIYSDRNRVRLRLILRGKRIGWSLAEIRELFDLYDSSHDEAAQLELMLEKLAKRKKMLKAQKRDIVQALVEIEQIEINTRLALKSLLADCRKTGTN